MSETNEDWMDEMLVIVTSKLGAGGDYPGKLVTAAEALEDYLDPQFRQAVQGVAQSGGTATVFMGQGGVVRAEIRRATRAEVLGQEDRLHEEDQDAPDVFSLREQLDEALNALAQLDFAYYRGLERGGSATEAARSIRASEG